MFMSPAHIYTYLTAFRWYEEIIIECCHVCNMVLMYHTKPYPFIKQYRLITSQGSQLSFLVWGQPNILWGQLDFEKWLSLGQPDSGKGGEFGLKYSHSLYPVSKTSHIYLCKASKPVVPLYGTTGRSAPLSQTLTRAAQRKVGAGRGREGEEELSLTQVWPRVWQAVLL